MPATREVRSQSEHDRSEQSLQEELLEEMFSPAPPEEELVPELADTETVSQATPADLPEEAVPPTETSPTTDPQESLPPPEPFVEQRTALQRRMEASNRLPPGARQHLTDAIAHASWSDSGEEQPALSVSQAIALLENVLPRQFVLDPTAVQAGEHPAGDIFFSGAAESLNDTQAAQLAAEQLAATGFASQK